MKTFFAFILGAMLTLGGCLAWHGYYGCGDDKVEGPCCVEECDEDCKAACDTGYTYTGNDGTIYRLPTAILDPETEELVKKYQIHLENQPFGVLLMALPGSPDTLNMIVTKDYLIVRDGFTAIEYGDLGLLLMQAQERFPQLEGASMQGIMQALVVQGYAKPVVGDNGEPSEDEFLLHNAIHFHWTNEIIPE